MKVSNWVMDFSHLEHKKLRHFENCGTLKIAALCTYGVIHKYLLDKYLYVALKGVNKQTKKTEKMRKNKRNFGKVK